MRSSHLEKETLAIAWAMDHFNLYLHENTFELHAGHKPLLRILQSTRKTPSHKPLLRILQSTRKTPSARLERLIPKTQRYNFHATHQKGSQNPANYLSRHALPQIEKDKRDNYLNCVINQNLPKKVTEDEVKRETCEEKTLWTLIKANSGNKLLWNTSHKPLLRILQSTRKTPSARLERLIPKTQRYNFHATHQKGSQNPANYLSRHALPQIEKDKRDNYLNCVINQNLPKKVTEDEVKRETCEEKTLWTLIKANSGNKLLWNTSTLKPFEPIKAELTVHRGLI
ncbi:RNase H-like domain found in reverse transcriptase [Popillia japonica]|uniref:RNase H-like domain found in reverse transcriptase n=1 Tax=Popillia japonica TaxID=7064 RepID=A0AAW1MYS6_POPJA